jgi:hypothetical protein
MNQPRATGCAIRANIGFWLESVDISLQDCRGNWG